MVDYLPKSDAALDAWSSAFSSAIGADPSLYGLTPSDAQAISQAVAAYSAACRLVSAPETRNAPNICTKNSARQAMIKVIRRYVKQIKANPEIGAPLSSLGLKTDDNPRNRIPAPATNPILAILSATPCRHVLRYWDAPSHRRGKPANVIGLQLFCHVGEQAPSDPLDARFQAFVTRQPHRVDFKDDQVGKTAFYYARWQTATGATGPWSKVVKMTVAG